MAKTSIEWTDTVWNPVTGCSKVSEGCRNCYAEANAKRFWKDRKFTDVQCHEDRLEQPLKWRKPRRVFVNSMGDLFHEDVPFEFVEKIWDVMFECPHHTFRILTKRPDRMAEFVREYAYKKHFGWEVGEKPPIRYGELISWEDFWMRQRCDWMVASCYDNPGCNHPENEDRQEVDLKEHAEATAEEECDTILDEDGTEGICHHSRCPIASDPSLADLKRLDEDLYEEYKLEPYFQLCHRSEDECYLGDITHDWMVLYGRPKGCFVENVHLGVSIEDQKTADERIPVLLQIPAAVRFVSYEPALERIDFSMALEDFHAFDPMLNRNPSPIHWLVIGHESGPSRRPGKIEHIESAVEQCRDAGVPVFVKQINFSGKIVKDINQFPKSLQVREFPK